MYCQPVRVSSVVVTHPQARSALDADTGAGSNCLEPVTPHAITLGRAPGERLTLVAAGVRTYALGAGFGVDAAEILGVQVLTTTNGGSVRQVLVERDVTGAWEVLCRLRPRANHPALVFFDGLDVRGASNDRHTVRALRLTEEVGLSTDVVVFRAGEDT